MFYDEFAALCAEKGISRTKACVDCGVSRTAWHKWENGATPNGATVNKFAGYFGVSVSKLLGEDTKKALPESGARTINDENVNESDLDRELVRLLLQLDSPQDEQRVKDFVQGILAARKAPTSPKE